MSNDPRIFRALSSVEFLSNVAAYAQQHARNALGDRADPIVEAQGARTEIVNLLSQVGVAHLDKPSSTVRLDVVLNTLKTLATELHEHKEDRLTDTHDFKLLRLRFEAIRHSLIKMEVSKDLVDAACEPDLNHATSPMTTVETINRPLAELKAEQTTLTDRYRNVWKQIAQHCRAKGMPYPIMTLTDSESVSPFLRLNHEDFLKKMIEVRHICQVQGVNCTRLLDEVTQTHQALDTVRGEIKSHEAACQRA